MIRNEILNLSQMREQSNSFLVKNFIFELFILFD